MININIFFSRHSHAGFSDWPIIKTHQIEKVAILPSPADRNWDKIPKLHYVRLPIFVSNQQVIVYFAAYV